MEEKDHQTKTRGRRGTKPSEVPVVTTVTPVTYLRSKDGKKSRKRFDKPLTGSTVASAAGLELAAEAQMIKRRQSRKTLSKSTDAAEAGTELGEAQRAKKSRSHEGPTLSMVDGLATGQKLGAGEQGGIGVVSGNEHAAADHRPSLLPLTVEALLPEGGIRSMISNQIKKRGEPRKLQTESTVSSGSGHEAKLLGIEVVSSKDGDVGSINTAPRKRKGRPRRFNIGTGNNLPAGAGISESDDQPLSMLYGLHCLSLVALDDPRHSSQLGDANRIDEAGEADKKADRGTPPASKEVLLWNGSSPLPFKKGQLFIWKAIESMDVFLRFPQNPHFIPLSDLKEDLREGLAVSHMVNFGSSVDTAFKLNITDPAEDINDCIDTLQYLEPHGFDVAAVQDHLKRMLSVKEVQEKLREEKKEVDNRAVELTYENSESDREIVELNEKMKRLQEEIASVKSKKGEKLSEIVFLKGKSASISQLIDEAALNMEDPAEYFLKVAAFIPFFLSVDS